MAIKLLSTKDVRVNGVKMLVYGQAGAGKTTLIKTLPKPIVLSAEAGLLSISDQDIPYIEIGSIADLDEAYAWLQTEEGLQYETVCLDSVSEIAEICLVEEKKKSADGRKAYGTLNEIISDKIRKFRDMAGRNVYFSAKMEKSEDEVGKIFYFPSAPGKQLSLFMPYAFDALMALRVGVNEEGVIERGLMCETDGLWQAKVRQPSGGVIAIQQWEAPDLGAIIKKIKGVE